jgi:drug/metabolite transporter (DMT)-like permease
LIGVVILKEKLLASEWLGIFILLIGAVILSITGKEKSESFMKIFPLVILTILMIIFIIGIGIGISKYKEGKPYEVGLAVIAGILFGINAIYMKAAGANFTIRTNTEFSVSSLEHWKIMLSAFYFYMVPLAGLSGFFISQWTFTHGRASIAVPIFTTISMVTPVIAGIFVFAESIALYRIIGIIIITIGALLLYRKGAAA